MRFLTSENNSRFCSAIILNLSSTLQILSPKFPPIHPGGKFCSVVVVENVVVVLGNTDVVVLGNTVVIPREFRI